jgi:hypothetical protein
MSTDTTPVDELPIVCDPNALTPKQRERWMEIGTQMYSAIEEIRELPNGYAFRLPNSPAMLTLIAEDLNMERLCCPFLRFTLELESNHGAFWLSFTGREGSKEFLRLSLEATNLIDVEVAKAVGFDTSARTHLDSVATAVEMVAKLNDDFAKRGDNHL